jgi:hypothetical protein
MSRKFNTETIETIFHIGEGEIVKKWCEYRKWKKKNSVPGIVFVVLNEINIKAN